MTRALAIGKRTHRLGAFVIVCEKEVVQAFMTEGFKKPFAVIRVSEYVSHHFTTVNRLTCRDQGDHSGRSNKDKYLRLTPDPASFSYNQ